MREHIRTFFAVFGAVCAIVMLMAANNGPVAIPTTVSNGGTGVATLASGNIPLGAGTSPFTALAGTNANDELYWTGGAWAATRRIGPGFTPLRGTSPLQTFYTGVISDTSATVTIGNLRAMPWIAPYTGTLDLIVAECTGTAANAVMRAGIYATGSDGYPSTLLVDSGEFTVAAAAMRTTSISLAVTAGTQYWLAGLAGTASPTMRVAAAGTGSASAFGAGFNTAYPSTTLGSTIIGITVAQAYGALPNPFTASGTAATTSIIPIIAVRYQ